MLYTEKSMLERKNARIDAENRALRLVSERGTITLRIDIANKGKKVEVPDVFLVRIGKEFEQSGGDESGACETGASQAFVEAPVLRGRASEGDGFLIHGELIV
jgi:hypothetical protein